jgi:hypothetical protein
MLTERGETLSDRVHGEPSKSPLALGSSKDGLRKRLEGTETSAVVVVGASEVAASEVIASAVVEAVRVSTVEESSAAEVVAVAVSVVTDEDSSSVEEENCESDVAVAVAVVDSEMMEDKSVIEDSAKEVAVEISVEAESSASVEVVPTRAVEDLGLHGPACPLPQSASATNVRENRVAFIVIKFVR